MKKIFLILILAFLLVSCNQVKKPKEEKKAENNKTEEILKTDLKEDINPNLESEITID